MRPLTADLHEESLDLRTILKWKRFEHNFRVESLATVNGVNLLQTSKRRICVAAFSLVLLASCGYADGQQQVAVATAPPQLAPATQAMEVVNTIPGFLAFWAAAESKDEQAQIEMFRKMVIQPHPELFTENIVDLGKTQGAEEENRRIASYLRQIRPSIPAIRVLNDRLQADLQQYAKGFTAVFPDYRPSTPVYFTVSLGHFDGATRDVGGRRALLFGVDQIASLYGADAKLSVLFDHELFHQYHGSLGLPQADDDDQLWRSLWEEGLATYVSWRMNPSADENEVLLSKTLAARARPLLPSLATDMLRNLQSKDSKEYTKYFLTSTTDKSTPARSGYFLGFLVVSRIGQSSTPLVLAHLSGAELESKIEQALKDLSLPAALPNPTG